MDRGGVIMKTDEGFRSIEDDQQFILNVHFTSCKLLCFVFRKCYNGKSDMAPQNYAANIVLKYCFSINGMNQQITNTTI